MNRRSAVKNLVIASGGLITLPFWMEACRMSDSGTHFSSFSPAEQETLAAITAAIIPAGKGAPGALSVGVDKFLQKLIDDCYEQPVKDEIKKQLAVVRASTEGGSTVSVGAILVKFSNSKDKAEKDFFDLMKSETIRGFNTSQEVMAGYLGYKIAPGHYYGCINIKG
jgi:hypothetical protein